ncbi:MAG: Ger(x)C family spore germination protein [Oscillospiraceae bacterium]|nr:Ger(x)C family spore germination protein [Oscillospiraceae bacterium]
MRRLIQFLLLIALLGGLLSGCWDYRSMNEIDIVAGIAVDRDEETGEYQLLLEVIDLNSLKEGTGGSNSLYIETSGKDIREALLNTQRRLYSTLFFSNMEVLVISKEIAETEGIHDVLEFFLSGAEVREAMSIVISGQDKAADILQVSGLDSKIASFEIEQMVRNYQKNHIGASSVDIFQAYAALEEEGRCLLLPVFKTEKNNNDTIVEACATAYFEEDKLVGMLNEEATRFYSLLVGAPTEIVLSVPSLSEPGQDDSYLVDHCMDKQSVRLEEGKLVISRELELEVTPQVVHYFGIQSNQQEVELEQYLSKVLEARLEGFFGKIQREVGIDVFDYAAKVYQQDPEAYEAVKDRWGEIFQDAELTVNANIQIRPNGTILRK